MTKKSVINPAHYCNNGYGIETIDMMRKVFGSEAVAIFCTINAFKYRMRAGKKDENPAEQDLAKEQWYLERANELRSPGIPFPEPSASTRVKRAYRKRGAPQKKIAGGGTRKGRGRPRKQREGAQEGDVADESHAGIEEQGEIAVRVDKRTTILIPAGANKDEAIRKYKKKQDKINNQLKHNNYDSNDYAGGRHQHPVD